MKAILATLAFCTVMSSAAIGQDIPRCMDRSEFISHLPRIIMSPAKAEHILIQQGPGLLYEEWRSSIVWVKTVTNLSNHICILTTGLII